MATQLQLINYLKDFVTPKRYQLICDVSEYRTNYITIALEDIYQSQNASAVLRTCDCFGISNVHIIENRNEYTINPEVALGSSQWLNLTKYNKNKQNTADAINSLKSAGYRIVATTPHTNDVALDDFDIYKGKTAFFFGTEMHGLSNLAIESADEFLRIPMYGFTESFNISVSAAIVLHHITTKIRNSDIDWQLKEEERNKLIVEWLKASIKRSDLIIERFNKQNSAKIFDDFN